MALKYLCLYLIITMMCVLSCTKSQQNDKAERKKVCARYYINKASDITVPYAKRLMYNQKAQELLLKQKNDSLTRKQLFAVAVNFQKLNSLEKSKKALIIGIQKSEGQGNHNQKATFCFYLGNYYKEIRSNDSAFYFYLKAEKQFLRSKNIRQLGQLYLNMSTVQIEDCFTFCRGL